MKPLQVLFIESLGKINERLKHELSNRSTALCSLFLYTSVLIVREVNYYTLCFLSHMYKCTGNGVCIASIIRSIYKERCLATSTKGEVSNG